MSRLLSAKPPTLPILLLLFAAFSCSHSQRAPASNSGPPAFLLGEFVDDYGIGYRITRSEWTQLPRARYRVVEWNVQSRYLIAQNHSDNPSDGGLWTRIDWVELPNMPPHRWAFCMAAYDAASAQQAKQATVAQGEQPKTGCSGFPYSRMRPASTK